MDSIDYYNRYAVPYYEKTVDADMGEVMKPFVELLPENAEVLDLGCGSGRDTLALEEYGFYVTPLDGAEKMCRLAEVNIDRDVLCMTYDEMDFDDVFDGIWACASFLHLQEKEVLGFFEKIDLYLNDNGVVYLSGKNGISTGKAKDGRYFLEFTEQLVEKILLVNRQLKLAELWYTEDAGDRKGFRWLNVILKIS